MVDISFLEELREKCLIDIVVDFNGNWTEGYKGLRNNIFLFTNDEEEFYNDINSCIVVSENGNIVKQGLSIAHKHYIAQKLALPYIIWNRFKGISLKNPFPYIHTKK